MLHKTIKASKMVSNIKFFSDDKLFINISHFEYPFQLNRNYQQINVQQGRNETQIHLSIPIHNYASKFLF